MNFQPDDSGNNLWVLVVDAREENFRRIRDALGKSNAKITGSSNLGDAFIKARTLQYSVVLLNLDLPDDVPVQIARQLPIFTKRCPVIVISSIRNHDLARLAAESGADSVYLLREEINGAVLYNQIQFSIKKWRWGIETSAQSRLITEKTQDLQDAQRMFPASGSRVSGELTTPHQITHTMAELQGAMSPMVLQLIEQINTLTVRIATIQAQFEITTASAEEKHWRCEEAVTRLNRLLFEDRENALAARLQTLEHYRAQQTKAEELQAWKQARLWAAIAGGALTLGAAILKALEHWWPK